MARALPDYAFDDELGVESAIAHGFEGMGADILFDTDNDVDGMGFNFRAAQRQAVARVAGRTGLRPVVRGGRISLRGMGYDPWEAELEGMGLGVPKFIKKIGSGIKKGAKAVGKGAKAVARPVGKVAKFAGKAVANAAAAKVGLGPLFPGATQQALTGEGEVVEAPPKTNYTPWLIGGGVVLLAGVGYLALSGRKKSA